MQLSISDGDSRAFANLSGDTNPLHTDPLAARRTPFGGTVVHGVHQLLAAIDRTLSMAAPRRRIGAVAAWFKDPLGQGDTGTLELSEDPEGAVDLILRGPSGHETLLAHLALGTVEDGDPLAAHVDVVDVAVDRTLAAIEGLRGTTPLTLDPVRLARLFPRLACSIALEDVATLLAATRIVGMHCPGLRSIFTRLRLSARPAGAALSRGELSWRVRRVHAASGQVLLDVDGPSLSGEIEAFFRPASPVQPSFAECRGADLVGVHALVVGGSRGLGEVTAKIVAAGGGHVTITYARGEADANRVCAEIRDGGGSARAVRFDVRDPVMSSELLRQLSAEADEPITQLYYFATPPIGATRAAGFSGGRFQLFADHYVMGFANAVRVLVAAASQRADGSPVPLRAFYPSTVFLDEPGLAPEYCAAKAAGEALARHLEKVHPRLTVVIARLPRLATDQTAALVGGNGAAPLPVLLDIVRRMPRDGAA